MYTIFLSFLHSDMKTHHIKKRKKNFSYRSSTFSHPKIKWMNIMTRIKTTAGRW